MKHIEIWNMQSKIKEYIKNVAIVVMAIAMMIMSSACSSKLSTYNLGILYHLASIEESDSNIVGSVVSTQSNKNDSREIVESVEVIAEDLSCIYFNRDSTFIWIYGTDNLYTYGKYTLDFGNDAIDKLVLNEPEYGISRQDILSTLESYNISVNNLIFLKLSNIYESSIVKDNSNNSSVINNYEFDTDYIGYYDRDTGSYTIYNCYTQMQHKIFEGRTLTKVVTSNNMRDLYMEADKSIILGNEFSNDDTALDKGSNSDESLKVDIYYNNKNYSLLRTSDLSYEELKTIEEYTGKELGDLSYNNITSISENFSLISNNKANIYVTIHKNIEDNNYELDSLSINIIDESNRILGNYMKLSISKNGYNEIYWGATADELDDILGSPDYIRQSNDNSRISEIKYDSLGYEDILRSVVFMVDKAYGLVGIQLNYI